MQAGGNTGNAGNTGTKTGSNVEQVQAKTRESQLVRILLVDDDATIELFFRHTLAAWGKNASFRPQLTYAPTVEHALCLLRDAGGETGRRRQFDIAFVDLHFHKRLSNADGFDFVRQASQKNPGLDITVFSSSNHFASAQSALRAGANDYIVKGVETAQVYAALERAVQRVQKNRKPETMKMAGAVETMETIGAVEPGKKSASRQKAAGRGGDEKRLSAATGLVGASVTMQMVRRQIELAAGSALPVVIVGESGTGKELAARGIHEMGGRRGKFIALDCATLTESMADSILFGHERGAFTGANQSRAGLFEQADQGTLFLDEISNLSLENQARLLRVLQEKQLSRVGSTKTVSSDFRVIVATNQPLERMIRAGEFKSDLYYRLNAIQIAMPPLRERVADIAQLVQYFVVHREISPSMLSLLQQHSWPGNVRELQNFLLTLDVFTPEGEPLHERYMSANQQAQLATVGSANSVASFADSVPANPLRSTDFLAQAYRDNRGNISRMARALGVDRSHLHQKLKRFGIHVTRSQV